MSRETDTPSSAPKGHGGAAYPSGTPPYGIPAVPADASTEAGRPAAQPEEQRKTETTLTTRVRINIPGSRPIPPVVVRKPVKDAESDGGPDAEEAAPSPAESSAAAEPSAPSVPPAAPAGGAKPASDWFAPRKPLTGKGSTGAGSDNGTGAPSGSGAGATGGAPAGAAAPTHPGAPDGASRGAGHPGGAVGSPGVPGASRNGAADGPAGGPVAPGHGGGTGSFDVTRAPAGPVERVTRPGGPPSGPRHDDLSLFGEGPGAASGQRGPAGGPAQTGRPGYGGPRPAGPTSGPVTGDTAMAPPADPFEGLSGPGGAGHLGGQGGVFSDDTAELTPQPPAGPGAPGHHAPGTSSTGRLPVVPPAFDAPDEPKTGTQSRAPEPDSPSPESSSRAPKKKGRSRLVLLCGGVVLIAGVAYGAGLLMNRSDVPKGTTVLGVDIGGGTRDEAVKKLDAALGKRLDTPLKLSVDGTTVELDPDKAGLAFDADATVGAAATNDYDPVTVIGSLFGRQRVVEPSLPVDEEKLQAALESAGGSGSVTEGSIRFESGKAVPVYPKAGKGIDVAKATDAVAQAYRTQVATGTSAEVEVPTTVQQPKISKAEVDRMMKEFAGPAMSGLVTVQTDPVHSVSMSPERSLWKFLRVVPVNDKLVDKPDLKALSELYGGTFDGVLITRGNGDKTPVTPQDVYGALRKALTSKTNRLAVIDTNPS